MKFLGDKDKKVNEEEDFDGMLEDMTQTKTDTATELEKKEELKNIGLRYYLKAGYPIIHIRSEEDSRAVQLVKDSIASISSIKGKFFYGEWKSTTGLLLCDKGALEDAKSVHNAKDLLKAISYITDNVPEKSSEPHIIVLHNINHWMKNPPHLTPTNFLHHRFSWLNFSSVGTPSSLHPLHS